MAAEKPFNQSSIPAFDQTTPVADVFSLARVPGIDHRIDSAEHEFLWLAQEISYPRGVKAGDALADITLKPVDSNPNVFRLPGEYISLQHVLNEAVGARGSGDRYAPEEAGPQSVRQALSRVGAAVGNLALKGGVLPISLDYAQIILERNGKLKPRLLPPAEFDSVQSSSPLLAFQELRRSLGSSMYAGSASMEQRSLVSVGLDAFYRAAARRYRGNQ